ncbi:hypothetical protein BOX15_Mlig025781g1 [Macrostomum lignano]|uniref:EF-hand domain-containing protein n=1 Tax=Macrostomum lignano TaxID=282301 RepID=A0A267GBH1_9PLAT|nr:hypothetical protein BOX15_Mlig025781g1 [Macrostomum lignano]
MGTNVSKDDVERVSKKLNLSSSTTKDLLKSFVDLGCGTTITREEFHQFVSRMGEISKERREAWNTVFNMLDLDGNQVIDFYEFSVAMIYHSKLTKDEKIENIFRMVDFDKDDKISYEELHKAVDAAARIKLAKRASLTNMKTVFADLAEGRKDKLNHQEFRNALLSARGKELLNLMGLL